MITLAVFIPQLFGTGQQAPSYASIPLTYLESLYDNSTVLAIAKVGDTNDRSDLLLGGFGHVSRRPGRTGPRGG